MLTIAVINYFIVASIGIYLLIKIFSKNPPKLLVGIIHGALGLLGFSFLILYISFKQGDTPVVSFLILLLAFFIGSSLLIATMTKKKYPKVIAFIHIATAITGICFLVDFWLN